MIPIRGLAMTKAQTLESSPCHPVSKKTIWTTSGSSYIKMRHAVIRHYERQGFYLQRYREVRILSLPALHFHLCDIQLGLKHHHFSNAKSQSSSYYTRLTLYLPRHSQFSRLFEITVILNHTPVVITKCFNIKRLLFT